MSIFNNFIDGVHRNMNIKIFLNKLVINGAKNIDKPVEFFFSNKTIKKEEDFSNSRIKAIYGPNGSGKSAIVSAMYIYKRLINSLNGINDNFFSNFILEVINKNTKSLLIDVVFTIIDSKPKSYSHHIELGFNDSNSLIIKRETISLLKGNTIKDDNFIRLVNIENGELKELKNEKNHLLDTTSLYINSLNLLSSQSITTIFLKLLNSKEYICNKLIYDSLLSILLFANNLEVELNKEDEHFDYITTKINNKLDNKEKNKSIDIYSLSTNNRDKVNVKDIEKYEDNIKGLCKYIKIFKPDLSEIIIDKKINDELYYCDKIFVYGKKKINVEFESTGIKKLVKMYSVLKSCANGSIAFIDEMDANLHDVYFSKLIEFFKLDSKGQLCFTTHNIEPIDILKSNSHSLDFISNDSRVYSWKKDGNKSPTSKYVNGLIPYSPFNVNSFDFDILLD